MKKLFVSAAAVAVALACVLLGACSNYADPVAFTADASNFDYTDKTVEDYMNYLQDAGEIAFEINDGFVDSINGTANTSNTYWLIYSNDEEYTTDDFTIEYEGEIYGLTTLGVTELPVKEGCVYVWYYQTF